MKTLKKEEVIRFSTMDEFTGEEMELTGTVKGDYREVRKRYPEEAGEACEGFYLVWVANRSGLFVVSCDEVLEILKKEEQ